MKKLLKISILSVSLLTIMASAAIAPALQTIQNHFSDVPAVKIQMILTLPAIFIIPVTLITGRLVFYIRKKTLLIVGVILYLIGGLGAGLVNTITMLLVLRSIMGLGVGLILPLATGLIADFYHGEERSQMMGYATAFNNLGGIIATVFAGILSVISWRHPFLVYLLGVYVLFMVIFVVPNQEVEVKTNIKSEVNKYVWMLGFANFYLLQIFFSIPASLSSFVEAKGFGSGLESGLLIALVTLGSFMFGVLFHRVRTILKGMTAITGLLFITIGVYLVAISPSIVFMGAALLLVGFGLGITAPLIYLHTSLQAKTKDVTLALALVSSFSFLGQFTSPVLVVFLRDIFDLTNANSPFVITSVIGVVGVVGLLINRKIQIYNLQ